jgi:hypothetical protein
LPPATLPVDNHLGLHRPHWRQPRWRWKPNESDDPEEDWKRRNEESGDGGVIEEGEGDEEGEKPTNVREKWW